MLNYSTLFADLERLFAGAGREPTSFRRLEREVARVEANLAEYCQEVAGDYVARIEQRLARADAQLSEDEVDLLRTYLGIAEPDPRREAQLVADLAAVEQDLAALLALQDRPLSLKNLGDLRRLLARMGAVLPRITGALEERRRLERFERAVGKLGPDGQRGEGPLDREWLRERLRGGEPG